jgi:hypothetical protein
VGEQLEKVVSRMNLGTGCDVLIALCTRADQSGIPTSTSVTSSEGGRLVPKLNRFGLAEVAERLSRNIYIRDGELHVSPYKEKEEEVAA